jgi:hypothetical protein
MWRKLASRTAFAYAALYAALHDWQSRGTMQRMPENRIERAVVRQVNHVQGQAGAAPTITQYH